SNAGLAGCRGSPAALQLESDKLIAGHFLRLAPCFPELVYDMAQDVQLGGEIGEIAADPLDRSKRRPDFPEFRLGRRRKESDGQVIEVARAGHHLPVRLPR